MRLTLAIAAAALTAVPLAANEVAIAFSRPSSERVTVELRHVARVADLTATPAVVHETSLDSPVTLDLLPGTWAIDVRGANVWHAQQTFNVTTDHTDVTANVWPAAIVRGRVEVEDRKPDVELRATFAPPEGAPAPIGTVVCPIQQHQFQCKLPATALDVRLRVRGYVTKFLWNEQLTAAKLLDAGTLHFVRGAVLLGRVEVPKDVPVALKDVRISATPSNADVAAKKIALNARLETRGFFHIDGLPPGKYDVTAAAAKYRSRAIQVVVVPELTAEMREPLRVEPPHTLRVTVSPPVDPSGHPWQVTLSEYLSEHHAEPVSGSRTNAAGEWSVSPIYPATYWLNVAGIDGSTWYSENVQVGDADLQKNVDLNTEHVTVHVTFGGKPLRTQVSLGGGPASIDLETAEDGTWSGVIPAGVAEWTANVTCNAPPVRRTMNGLKVKRTTNSDERQLNIDLPNNAIMGTVVRKDGAVADRALVNIGGGERVQQVETEPDGSFFIAGLAPGRYTVSASAFPLESPGVETTVEDGSVPDPLRLVLDDSTKIHGQVLSDAGPVAGAEVVVASTDVAQTFSAINMTDEKGEFSTTVGPGAKEIDVFVGAPGFALKFFHTHIRGGSLIVNVDQRGGRLTIASPQPGDHHRPYLVHNGMWYPADALLQSSFAHADGEEIVIPAIDAGAYSLCDATDTEANASRHGIMFGRPCKTAFLAPYGASDFGVRSR